MLAPGPQIKKRPHSPLASRLSTLNSVLLLLVSVTLLLLLGATMLNSATVMQPDPIRFHLHLVWMSLGAALCLLLSFFDYRRFKNPRIIAILVGLAYLSLVLVLIFGRGANGARRWLWGGQPSELAKIILILALAWYGARYQSRMAERTTGFVKPGLLAVGMMFLIFLEPDWGTAILVGAITGIILYIAGTHWTYLLSSAIIGALLFVHALLMNPLRLGRILSCVDPEKYQHSWAWQVWHAILSIGSGGLWGKFFGNGTLISFVPEQETDFFFSLVGEELGFIGTTAVLLAFLVIIICGLKIAFRIADPFGQLLAAGITFLIGFQAFINIGVVTSVLPNKGLSLPFMSYGGSNLVCMLACVGLLISIARHAPRLPPVSKPKAEPQRAAPREILPLALASNPFEPPLPEAPASRCSRWHRLAFWRRHRHPAFYKTPCHSYQRLPQKRSLLRLDNGLTPTTHQQSSQPVANGRN